MQLWVGGKGSFRHEQVQGQWEPGQFPFKKEVWVLESTACPQASPCPSWDSVYPSEEWIQGSPRSLPVLLHLLRSSGILPLSQTRFLRLIPSQQPQPRMGGIRSPHTSSQGLSCVASQRSFTAFGVYFLICKNRLQRYLFLVNRIFTKRSESSQSPSCLTRALLCADRAHSKCLINGGCEGMIRISLQIVVSS